MFTVGATRTARWLVVGIAFLGVGHVARHVFQSWFDALPGSMGHWADMNVEASVATWYNVALLLLVATGALLAAAGEPSRRARAAWVALGTAVLLLSIDESISVHERLPDLLGMDRGTLGTHEWLIPGVVLAGVGLTLVALLVRALDRRVRVGLLVALLVYAAGAVGAEALSGAAVRAFPIDHPLRLAMPVWELIEESLEMLGCVLALATVQSHLQRAGILVLAAPAADGAGATTLRGSAAG